MAEKDGDGFLDRWSRRKRGEASPEASPGASPEASPGAVPEAEPAVVAPAKPLTKPMGGRSGPPSARARAAAVDQPQLEDPEDTGDPEVVAKLPDLDSLNEDSDFSAFLQDGVPDALRRQALRRLWRLNPVFANLDGLNEYDENFSALGMVAENLKTIYKVGRGYLDEDETETEDEVVAEPDGETGGEGPGAEPGTDATPDSDSPNPVDPIESVQISQATPTSAAASPADGDAETNSEKPIPGSARARRWGGNPDKD